MSVPSYGAYRDTGVEWLGAVPSHWQVVRLNALFREVSEPGSDDLPVLSVSIHSGVSDTELADNEIDRVVARSEDRSKYKRVEPNDLVYNMMRAWQGGFGAVQTVGAVSPAYVVARPTSSQSTRFVERLLRTPNAVGEMKRLSKGVTDFRLRLYWDEFKNIKVALPPPNEQIAIDAFLDRETGKIDALVEAQRRLIELQVARIASIALTQMDAGWTRLGNLVETTVRPVELSDSELYTRLGLNNRGRGLFHKEPALGRDIGDSKFFWIEGGDLILSGQFAWEGAVALAGESETGTVVSHRYPVLRGRKGVMRTEAIFALLTSRFGGHLLSENSRGAAGRNRPLNLRSLLKERVPILDQTAQNRVAEAVHARAKAAGELKRLETLLQEHRTALISAAVTGKIDVRGLALEQTKAA